MLGISGGFKRRKPRQFSYKPLYFNPEEEEQNRKIAMRGGETGKEYKPGSLVKGMRMERYSKSTGINSKRESNDARNRIVMRLVIFLFLLILVAYIIMNSTMIENFFTIFSK